MASITERTETYFKQTRETIKSIASRGAMPAIVLAGALSSPSNAVAFGEVMKADVGCPPAGDGLNGKPYHTDVTLVMNGREESNPRLSIGRATTARKLGSEDLYIIDYQRAGDKDWKWLSPMHGGVVGRDGKVMMFNPREQYIFQRWETNSPSNINPNGMPIAEVIIMGCQPSPYRPQIEGLYTIGFSSN